MNTNRFSAMVEKNQKAYYERVKKTVDTVYKDTLKEMMMGFHKMRKDSLYASIGSVLTKLGIIGNSGNSVHPVYKWKATAPNTNIYDLAFKALKSVNERRNCLGKADKAVKSPAEAEKTAEEKAADAKNLAAIKAFAKDSSAISLKEVSDAELWNELLFRGWKISDNRLSRTVTVYM